MFHLMMWDTFDTQIFDPKKNGSWSGSRCLEKKTIHPPTKTRPLWVFPLEAVGTFSAR